MLFYFVQNDRCQILLRLLFVLFRMALPEMLIKSSNNGFHLCNIVIFFRPRPRHIMSAIQAIVRDASLVPVHLPNISTLKDALDKALEWSKKVDHVQV